MSPGPDAGAAPALGVLVGGHSRRFPGGKLRATLAGEPLLLRVLSRVAAAGRRHLLLGALPGDLPVPPGWEVLPDARPERGPLEGFRALSLASPEGFVAVAGDMPFLEAAALTQLWELSAGHAAAVVSDRGRTCPLLCALRPPAWPPLRELADREPPPGPWRLLEALEARCVEARELVDTEEAARRLVLDVDTPEALEAVRALLE